MVDKTLSIVIAHICNNITLNTHTCSEEECEKLLAETTSERKAEFATGKEQLRMGQKQVKNVLPGSKPRWAVFFLSVACYVVNTETPKLKR